MAEAKEVLTINFITEETVPLAAHINVKSLMLAYRVPAGSAPHTQTVYTSHEYCLAKPPVQALLIPCSLMMERPSELCQRRGNHRF